MIDGLMREVNRVAGERDRDVGHQVQPANRRRQRERRDHVVRSLEGEDPAGPGVAQGSRALDRIDRSEQRRHETA